MESYYPEVLEKKDFIEKLSNVKKKKPFARTFDSGQHFAQTIVEDFKKSQRYDCWSRCL